MFRKKKEQADLPDLPRVLGASNINTIQCVVCKSIYHPEHRHVSLEPADYFKVKPDIISLAACPLCGYKNEVKFEKPSVFAVNDYEATRYRSMGFYVSRPNRDKVQEAYDILSSLMVGNMVGPLDSKDVIDYLVDKCNEVRDILKSIVGGG